MAISTADPTVGMFVIGGNAPVAGAGRLVVVDPVGDLHVENAPC